jgi:hypothetical protein
MVIWHIFKKFGTFPPRFAMFYQNIWQPWFTVVDFFPYCRIYLDAGPIQLSEKIVSIIISIHFTRTGFLAKNQISDIKNVEYY